MASSYVPASFKPKHFKKGFQLLREFSAFLLLGTAAALLWANLGDASYTSFIDDPIIGAETLRAWAEGGGVLAALGAAYEWLIGLLTHGHVENFTFHFFANDIFMVLFFGVAGKEVAESFLPGGALSSVRKASMPVVATLGGVIGPIGLFFLLFFLLDPDPAVANAWAVPAATDIAYCWLFARLIFGKIHPAVTFLLVLAVLDDMIGMLIIATYYTASFNAGWLLLVVLGMALCELMRRQGVTSYWPYVVIGGILSWFGLHNTGVHASLALVPIVPFMPHAHRDAGLFVESEYAHDTLNRFEHTFAPVVDVGLFMFGLANAGVVLSATSFTGSATWIIFLSLVVGKTLGIFSFGWIGQKLGLRLPRHLDNKKMLVLGCVAGVGFTVALFVTAVALETAPIPTITGDMLKLGALLSFVAGPIAWMMARAFKVRKINTQEELGGPSARADAEGGPQPVEVH